MYCIMSPDVPVTLRRMLRLVRENRQEGDGVMARENELEELHRKFAAASEEAYRQQNPPVTFPFCIPGNDLGVTDGYYGRADLVKLLRDNCEKPDVVYFIADMLES